jgi:hypothetical protein
MSKESVSIAYVLEFEESGLTLGVTRLFVKVCVPDNVATVLSIAIVTAVEPLKLVPDNPVPIVKAFVVVPFDACQVGAMPDPLEVST